MAERPDEFLRELDRATTGEPPEDLVRAAREAGGGLRGSWRAHLRRVGLGVFGTCVVLVGLSFTPPGRAATDWIADLAGIGDEPSLEQIGAVRGSAVVVDVGQLEDGTSYEVVAKRITSETLLGPNHPARDGGGLQPFQGEGLICFQVDFPAVTKAGQGGHCTEGEENGSGLGYESVGLYQRPAPSGGDTDDVDSPALFMGIVEAPPAESVRVEAIETDGTATELPSRLVTVDGELLEKTGYSHPASIFVSPIDESVVVAGNRDELNLRATAYDAGEDPIGYSEAIFPGCGLTKGTLPAAPPGESPEPEPILPEAAHGQESDGAAPSPGGPLEEAKERFLILRRCLPEDQ